LERVEDYTNKVGYSERNQDTAVEPRLCKQWFLSMKHFAEVALPPVLNDDIKFHPAKYKTTYRNWLENIQDWCISRQLWWGHRIPAYFMPTREGEEERFVVALTLDEAVEKARKIDGYENITREELHHDEDALDTWFSSWLWPISLFDGINNPNNPEIEYYYPTSDLVTGPDIIFFWVARMIMAGYEYMGKMPFRNVYFTGIVRDKLGRKMSKSLGNSPDPIALIDKYGADGVRMGMMLSAPAGNDILFDEALCEQGRNFCNKIWNAFRLVEGWNEADIEQPQEARIAIEWFSAKLRQTQSELNDLLKKYRISDALMLAYKTMRDEFSAWYLEMVKPAYGQPIDKATLKATKDFFAALLELLHPFMPFITEELWQHLYERGDKESIMTHVIDWQETTENDAEKVRLFEEARQIVVEIRAIRNQKNISQHQPLTLEAVGSHPYQEFDCAIKKMANVDNIVIVEEKSHSAIGFMVGTSSYAVPMNGMIDTAEEIKKLEAQLEHLESFLAGVKKKLQNEKFVAHAPEAVVALERKKQSDSEEKIAAIRQTIAELKQ